MKVYKKETPGSVCVGRFDLCQCRNAANAKAKANLQFKVFNYEVEGYDVRVSVFVNCPDIQVDEDLVIDKATIKISNWTPDFHR